MKKVMILVGILFLMVLTACGGTSSENTAVAAPVNDGSSANSANSEDTTVATSANNEAARSIAQLNDKYENALPVQVQLALGTMILEGDTLALDATQAADLLPLWRAVQSMSESGTAADVEISAVLNHIQAGMMSEQIATIADMQLTQDAMRSLVQDGVIAIEAGDVKRGSAGGAAGGPPGDGGPLGGQTDPARQATRQTEESGGGNAFLNQAVTTAVVQLLEKKLD